MVVRRWQQRAGPAVLAVAVLGLFGVGGAGADAVAWSPPACGAREPDPQALARPVTEDAAGRAWWRLEPRLDGSGRQVAQRVTLGSPSGGPARIVELDAESFAAGPFGSFVLTGSDDGRSSDLRLLDLDAGCAWSIATERSVIRRAILDPSGSAVYEFRVDRRTRADLGVWRRPLDGSAARRVLPPVASDARFGRTFSTELSWSVEGDRLVVQSCGAFACRTRVFDPRAATTIQVDEPDLGELVGVAGHRLVTYVACRGLPCPLVAVDVSDGARTTLTEAAGLAVLVDDARGARVIHEDGAAASGHLRVVAPDGVELDRFEVAPDARLVPAPGRAQAAAGLPPGWVVLAGDTRPWSDRGPATLLRPGRAGSAAPFEEVSR